MVLEEKEACYMAFPCVPLLFFCIEGVAVLPRMAVLPHLPLNNLVTPELMRLSWVIFSYGRTERWDR